MDAIRGLLGIAAPQPVHKKKANTILERKKQAAQERPHHERLKLAITTQTLQIGQLQEDVDELNEKIQLAAAANDRRSAGVHIAERKRIQLDIDTRQKKLANTRAQLQAIETANANLEQGLLMREGADELKSAVEAMDTIDLNGAVDDMQEAASMVNEHNDRLTDPIFGGGEELADEVNAELDAVMAARMPSVPTVAPVKRIPANVAVAPPPVTVSSQKRVAAAAAAKEKEEK